MGRILVLVVGLWVGLAGLAFALRSPTPPPCEPLCWQPVRLGMPASTAGALLEPLGFSATQRGYEDGRITVLVVQDAILRIDGSWQSASQRPNLAQVLQTWGAPDLIHLQGESIANLRRMTYFLFYDDGGGAVSLVSLRRIANDPADFGEFRPLPGDDVVTVSRFQGGSLPPPVDPWHGLGRYRVLCC